MTDYLLDPRDLAFQLYDVLSAEKLTGYSRFSDHNRETFDAVLNTAKQIAEDKFRPHNQASDADEPKLVDGKVVVHPDVKPAIEAFTEAGFLAAHHDFDRGGMQLPWTIAQAAFAYFQAANVSSIGYSFLTIAAANLIDSHASEELKARYLPPMLDGRFFGTMVLSEPQAGSSLSDIRTTATKQADGSYRLKGSKMWISGGEHELSDNIVHLVLARTDDAPKGVKGLSLFLVPRYRLDDNGDPGPFNDVTLVGLNHKMGYRGTVNTALSFGDTDDCRGWLIGAEQSGLAYMFHMMNEARIGVGMGAVMLAYTGYLHSLDYARSRPQGRHPEAKDPASPQIPLVDHADVRRMLLQQKAVAEGGLALGLWCANLVDVKNQDQDETKRKNAGLLLDLLTPVIKSWFSDQGLKANENAIQIHGGYGYTREFPVEQFYRDNRLNPIHEGANGIQAMDLLGRKVVMSGGAALQLFNAEIEKAIADAAAIPELAPMAKDLADHAASFQRVTAVLVERLASEGATRGLANAAYYMDAMGYLVLSWLWLRQATTAMRKLDAGEVDTDFLNGKIQTCHYVFGIEAPKLRPLLDGLEREDMSTFDMQDSWF